MANVIFEELRSSVYAFDLRESKSRKYILPRRKRITRKCKCKIMRTVCSSRSIIILQKRILAWKGDIQRKHYWLVQLHIVFPLFCSLSVPRIFVKIEIQLYFLKIVLYIHITRLRKIKSGNDTGCSQVETHSRFFLGNRNRKFNRNKKLQ